MRPAVAVGSVYPFPMKNAAENVSHAPQTVVASSAGTSWLTSRMIEWLRELEPVEYRKYGWMVMLFGKVLDSAITLYALESIPTFIEANPIPALAYQQYGMLGLVALTGVAILWLAIVVETGAKIVEGESNEELVPVIGYWLPGLFWIVVSYSNYHAITTAQTLF